MAAQASQVQVPTATRRFDTRLAPELSFVRLFDGDVPAVRVDDVLRLWLALEAPPTDLRVL